MLYETESLRVTADRGVATLWLDFPGPQPNLLNAARLLEIDAALDSVLPDPSMETLIIRSAKLAGFCAGFDVTSLMHLRSENDLREFAALGQRLFNRIADAECITIANIHGPCLGPGLELALACDYRLAVASADSAFGFGDVPTGWGGLSRLPRIAGASRAVELLLKSAPVSAREAVKLGFVDQAFCERRAKIELQSFLDRDHRKPRRWQTPLDGWAARRVVGAYRQAESDSVWSVIPSAATSLEAGLRAERLAFAEMVQTDRGQSSWTLAQTRQRLRDIASTTMATVAVIGPVEPLADLLAEVIIRGGAVHLVDHDDGPADATALTRAIDNARMQGRLTPLEADQARSRIRSNSPSRCDAVVVTMKTAAAVEAAETIAGPATPIICTGDRKTLATYATRPQRLFGVAVHESIVEIIRPADVDATALTAIRQHMASLGVTPMIVGDRRGSVIHRVQTAYWDEAVHLVADGVPIARIDAAARMLGAIVGPLETMDGLGLPMVASQVPGVKPLLAAGIHGRPGDEGFYRMEADRRAGPNAAAQAALIFTLDSITHRDDIDAAERLRWRLVNAAAAALAGDAYLNSDDVDFAIVQGLGLLADDGGPLRLAERVGYARSVARLRQLAAEYGDRFQPHAEISRHALAEEFEVDATPAEWQLLKRSA